MDSQRGVGLAEGRGTRRGAWETRRGEWDSPTVVVGATSKLPQAREFDRWGTFDVAMSRQVDPMDFAAGVWGNSDSAMRRQIDPRPEKRSRGANLTSPHRAGAAAIAVPPSDRL